MTKLKAAYPAAATLIAVSPFDTTAYSTTLRDAIATDMSAAATAVGGWTFLRSCSSAGSANFSNGWLTSSGDLTDGTHPNSTGYTKIYNNLVGSFVTAPSLSGGGAGGGSIFGGIGGVIS